MRIPTILLTCSALALAGLCLPASATCVPGQVDYVGELPSDPLVAEEGGTALAISVLFRTLPDGWSVSGNPADGNQVLVQWQKGRTWLPLLGTLARAANWCIDVNFMTHNLTVRKAEARERVHGVAGLRLGSGWRRVDALRLSTLQAQRYR